jgi:prolipoprotein diacylglyceryltransferase
MRQRVMNRAQAEMGRRTFRFPWLQMPRWQAGLALAGLLILLVSSLSDMSREKRLAALESSDYAQPRVLLAQRPLTLGESRAQACRLLNDSGSDIVTP